MKGKFVVNFIRLLSNLPVQYASTFQTIKPFTASINFCQMKYFTHASKFPLKRQYRSVGPYHLSCRRQLATVLKTQEIVSPSEMINYLETNKLELKKGFTCWQCTCPTPAMEQTTAVPKIVFINMTTGMFIDYDQKISGSWHIFKDLMQALTDKTNAPVKMIPSDPDIFVHYDQQKELELIFNSATPVVTLSSEEFTQLTDVFCLKRLRQEIFQIFDVRVSKERRALLFPYHDPAGKLSGIRTLMVVTLEDGTEDILDTFAPKMSPLSLFGCQETSTKVMDQVVVTGSPLDAMAVMQECNLVAVTLPKPHAPLPQEILPRFEKYVGITFWLGNSLQDWETTKTLVRKLGMQRCCFVRPMEDQLPALQTLQKGVALKNILLGAQSVLHKSITTFRFLKDDVLQELNNLDLICGVKWSRFPGLTRLLKGHRRGELTVFTGPTGAGKTTLMGEYSLDLCSQGVITLWGSFEIPNVRLAKMMMNQFSLIPLEKNLDRFEEFAHKFEELPFYFLTLHGQQSLSSVLDAMSHAVYMHDIQHILVDNLQFMMGMDSQGDRYWRQDLVVSAFRQFATKNNCHITLVMHPRKENETDELSINSIFGGVKASQEADNIIILQDRRLETLRGRKYLQVTKNRFDGELGVVPLEFDKETKSFAVKKKSRTSAKIIEDELNELNDAPAQFNRDTKKSYPYNKKQWTASSAKTSYSEFNSATSKFNKGTTKSYSNKKTWNTSSSPSAIRLMPTNLKSSAPIKKKAQTFAESEFT